MNLFKQTDVYINQSFPLLSSFPSSLLSVSHIPTICSFLFLQLDLRARVHDHVVVGRGAWEEGNYLLAMV